MRTLALIAAVGLAVASAACSVDKPDLTLPTTDANVVGSFNLVTADNHLLPFIAIITSTEAWELDADRIVLASDNTWVDSTAYTVQDLSSSSIGPKVTVATGTYAIADGLITFTKTSGGSGIFTGSVFSNSLAVNSAGKRYLYTR